MKKYLLIVSLILSNIFCFGQNSDLEIKHQLLKAEEELLTFPYEGQMTINVQYNNLYKMADSLLNEVYQSTLNLYNDISNKGVSVDKQEYIDLQRAWIDFKEKEEDYIYNKYSQSYAVGNNLGQMMYWDYYLLTKERILHLLRHRTELSLRYEELGDDNITSLKKTKRLRITVDELIKVRLKYDTGSFSEFYGPIELKGLFTHNFLGIENEWVCIPCKPYEEIDSIKNNKFPIINEYALEIDSEGGIRKKWQDDTPCQSYPNVAIYSENYSIPIQGNLIDKISTGEIKISKPLSNETKIWDVSVKFDFKKDYCNKKQYKGITLTLLNTERNKTNLK